MARAKEQPLHVVCAVEAAQFGEALDKDVTALATVAQAVRAKGDQTRVQRDTQLAARHKLVGGAEMFDRNGVRDHMDRAAPENAALCSAIGQPLGRADDMQVPEFGNRIMFERPVLVSEIPTFQERAFLAGGPVAFASLGVVASAGKGIHVMQGPDNRLIAKDFGQRRVVQHAGDPVQVDHIRSVDGRAPLGERHHAAGL